MTARVLCLAFLALPLLGSVLTWEPRMIRLEVTTADKDPVATYTCVNPSAKPIRIIEAKTGCDCATADLAGQVIQAGEKREFHVTFHLGSRTGLQQRTIEVRTDDETSPTDSLELEVNIAEELAVKPKLLFWARGADSAEKACTLKILNPSDCRVIDATVDGNQFKARLLSADEKAPAQRTVLIAPLSTGEATQAQITIRYEIKGRVLEARVFAAVR